MRGLRRSRLFTAFALLAALGFVVAAEAFEHTDDGCAVEIHCLPCQWAHGATVVLAVVPQPSLPVDLGLAAVFVRPQPLRDSARLGTPSRAPPLA